VKRKVIAAVIVVLVSAALAAAAEPKTDEEKTLYALGLALSQNLAPFKLSEQELELVKAGVTDGALGREKKVDLEKFGPKINEFAKARAAQVAAGEKKSSEGFLAKAAAEKGAQKTASGLVYTEVKAGAGDAPKATDTVKVHYTGKLTDGTVFDSSVKRGEPATFPLNQVIRCWTEGLQLMKVGGKATLVCPSDIAYGDQGRPPQIKPGATLVFDVELLEIVKK
jgi:FKBP-type peptidyl-prolyl cis-trans isomerase FkpA